MPSTRARSAAAAATAASAGASPTPNSTRKDATGPPARSPLAARATPPNADANDAAARAATDTPAAPAAATATCARDPSSSSSDLDYSQATEAIREAELSRVPLARDHVAQRRRRGPVISPTDLSGADWCQLRTAFRLVAPWLAARDEDEETNEMRRGKEAHREREEEAPPGLTLQQAVALGLRGPDARVTVEPQTRADRLALRLLESASALAELLQFGRAREVWVFGRVPVPSLASPGGPAASAAATKDQWLTGIVDQVERRPKGSVARAAAESAAAARGENVATEGPPLESPAAASQQQRRRRRRSGGGEEPEEHETLVTELKTRGGGGSAPSEAALRGAAMQAALYRRLLAGLAREAEAEAAAAGADAAASATPRPGGFLEAQGLSGEEAFQPLSEEVAALVGECERVVAALLPPPQSASQQRVRPRRASQAAVRPSSPGCSVIVLSAESPAAAASSPSRRQLRPRRSQSAAPAASPAATQAAPPPPTKTLADALRALSRLAAAALPPPADHVRVEFIGQGEGRPLVYGAWVDVPGAPGRALARRAGRHLAFLRGLRAPTRRSGDALRDSGCRWCVFRERCAGLGGVKEDGEEADEEEEEVELF